MPIRRTTARLAATGALALGSAGLLAGPAWAQDPYPPPPIDITVTTPGATIEITGSAWEPGTVVTITRRGGDRAGASAEPITATVADDGTFTAPVEVPENTGGREIQYEVSGVDDQGAERTETHALNVQLTSAEAPAEAATELAAPVTPTDDGDAGWALAVGGAVALAGGAAVARRKVTSKG